MEHERHIAQPEEGLHLPETVAVLASDSESGLVLTRRRLAVVGGEPDVAEADVRVGGHDPMRRVWFKGEQPGVHGLGPRAVVAADGLIARVLDGDDLVPVARLPGPRRCLLVEKVPVPAAQRQRAGHRDAVEDLGTRRVVGRLPGGPQGGDCGVVEDAHPRASLNWEMTRAASSAATSCGRMSR